MPERRRVDFTSHHQHPHLHHVSRTDHGVGGRGNLEPGCRDQVASPSDPSRHGYGH